MFGKSGVKHCYYYLRVTAVLYIPSDNSESNYLYYNGIKCILQYANVWLEHCSVNKHHCSTGFSLTHRNVCVHVNKYLLM